MNSESKTLSTKHFTTLWFGASVSIAEILTGGLLAPLGFKKALLAIIIGHGIGTALLVMGGIIGFEKNMPSIKSTRISFGSYGSYVFSILNVLQLIGWTAVMIISGGRSLNMVSKMLWNFDNMMVWSILIGILVCLWVLLGSNTLKKLNSVAVILLFILTLVLSFVIFKNNSLLTKLPEGNLSFGAAIELNIVMPLSWLPLIADYTRFAKDKKSAVTGSFLGYFFGSCWMYIIGLGAALIFNTTDIGEIMVAANLGVFALSIIILATVTTTFMDVYSAGISFLNINSKLKETPVALIMGILGTLIALIFPIEQYENFLYAIGSVFAPMFAILFTDYFILKKNNAIEEGLKLNIGAVIVWIIGIITYYSLLKIDFFIGNTLPTMLLTSLIYFVSWRFTKSWKLEKNFLNS